MKMTVSVVMPCHNGMRWLAAAMTSVLGQTMRDLELIVVDDGSTDGSPAIMERLARNDARVRVVRFDANRGIVAALNAGLDHAGGDLIARMDADDVCVPDRLERQLAYMDAHALDLCGSWFVEFGQGPARTVRWPVAASAVRASMLFQNSLCHPTVVARRAVFERFRYREDYRMVEDYDLWSRACVDFAVGNVPAPLLKYRRHGQQASTVKRDAMEVVNRRIRAESLQRQGFAPSVDELRLHNMVRASASITGERDLAGIEAWLLKLHDAHADPDAREVVASQWLRACIRAAPLGGTMLRAWRDSPLRRLSGAGRRASFDLRVLSMLRLDYRSSLYSSLRRLGLSA